MQQHVDGKDQGSRRTGPPVIGQEFADDDRATRRERGKDLAQKLPAPLASLAVENVAERGHAVPRAEFRFQEITRYRPEPVPNTMPLSHAPGHLQHRRPIDGVNRHVRRLLRQGNPPHSRPGAEIEHAHWRSSFGDAQVFTQNLRCPVTHWKKPLDEFGKELLPVALVIGLHNRPPVRTASDNCNQLGKT